MRAPLASSFKSLSDRLSSSEKGGPLLKNPIVASIIVTFISVAIFVHTTGMTSSSKFVLAVVINSSYLYLFYAAVRSFYKKEAARGGGLEIFQEIMEEGHPDHTDETQSMA